MLRIFLVMAGVFGACGVVAGALAAHKAPGTGLDQASQLLLVHAVAIMTAVSLLDREMLSAVVGRLAVIGWVLGTALFAGDIALRALAGIRLFPMAAPTGGTVLIVSWAVLAAGAVLARGRP